VHNQIQRVEERPHIPIYLLLESCIWRSNQELNPSSQKSLEIETIQASVKGCKIKKNKTDIQVIYPSCNSRNQSLFSLPGRKGVTLIATTMPKSFMYIFQYVMEIRLLIPSFKMSAGDTAKKMNSILQHESS